MVKPKVGKFKSFNTRFNSSPVDLAVGGFPVVGDKLVLKEYDPKAKEFTGQSFITEITFITDYQQKDGYVVLGTKDLALDVYRRMSELGLIK